MDSNKQEIKSTNEKIQEIAKQILIEHLEAFKELAK